MLVPLVETEPVIIEMQTAAKKLESHVWFYGHVDAATLMSSCAAFHSSRLCSVFLTCQLPCVEITISSGPIFYFAEKKKKNQVS